MHSFACLIYYLFLTFKVLFWLPHNLPEGTILIVSANSSHSEILEELVSKRSFDKMEIQEMSEEMRQEFAKVCKSTSIQNLFQWILQEWRLKGKNSSRENIYLNWLCNLLEWHHYLQARWTMTVCKFLYCKHCTSVCTLYLLEFLNFYIFLNVCAWFFSFFFFLENSNGARKRVISLSNEENCGDCCCKESPIPEGSAECKMKRTPSHSHRSSCHLHLTLTIHVVLWLQFTLNCMHGG